MGAASAELRKALSSCILTASICCSTNFGHLYNKIGDVLFKEQWHRRAIQSMGMLHSASGDWKKADNLLNKSSKESETIGDLRTSEECALYLAYNKFFEGNTKKALDLSDNALSSARSRGDLQMQVLSLITKSHVHYATGRLTEFYESMKMIEGYSAEESTYKMDTGLQLHYHGLLAIKWLKEGNKIEAYNEAMIVEKFSKDAEPTMYFGFLGYYYASIVCLLILMRNEDWIGGQHKILKITSKKFMTSLGKLIKSMEDFSKLFRVALPWYSICNGLMDQVSGKKKTLSFEEGLQTAKILKMTYVEALLHNFIGMSMSIRDDTESVAEKMKHRDIALESFIQLNVQHTQLMWQLHS